MSLWAGKLAELLSRNQALVLLTVIETKGSVPREAGTKMLVAADGSYGTIGGGHLEFQCMTLARQRLNQQSDWRELTQRFPLGVRLGQCCGGLVVVSLQYIESADAEVFADVGSAPVFNLVLFGAGHVGQAVVKALADIDCAVTWVDSREEQFPAEIPSNTQRVISDYSEDEVDSAPTDSCFLVMTHSHQLDYQLCEQILKRDDFRYCGLIGSLTKRRKFEQRMRAKGIAEERLRRLTCPIGISGISGKEPAVIAVAVVAQLLLVGDS